MNRLNTLMDMIKEDSKTKTKKFISLYNTQSDIQLDSNKNYKYYDPCTIMKLQKQGFYNNYPYPMFSEYRNRL